MDSELFNEAGNKFKILGSLIKDSKWLYIFVLQKWDLK